MTVRNSSFVGNIAAAGNGGVFLNFGTLTIVNSTLYGNSAVHGGAIYNYGGTLSITNSDFENNSATAGAGQGASLYNDVGPVTVANTIFAIGNTAGNCVGMITNAGNNIDDGTTCGWGSASGSMSGTNPMLGPVAGSPEYFTLLPGSPAIDGATFNAPDGAPSTDERGRKRPQGPRYDIGAYEADASLTVKSTAAQDGWVRESSQASGVGGSLNSAATTFNLGDDLAARQFRGILSFSTGGAGLPENAVITSVRLKVM